MTLMQEKALAFIRSYMAANGDVSPSYDEIMVGIGLRSKSGVHRIVQALLDRGHLHRENGHARSLVPTGESEFERGRSSGYVEGYRAAVKERGPQINPPSQTRANTSTPVRAVDCRPVEQATRSRPAPSFSTVGASR